jgi:hypothetical protein
MMGVLIWACFVIEDFDPRNMRAAKSAKEQQGSRRKEPFERAREMQHHPDGKRSVGVEAGGGGSLIRITLLEGDVIYMRNTEPRHRKWGKAAKFKLEGAIDVADINMDRFTSIYDGRVLPCNYRPGAELLHLVLDLYLAKGPGTIDILRAHGLPVPSDSTMKRVVSAWQKGHPADFTKLESVHATTDMYRREDHHIEKGRIVPVTLAVDAAALDPDTRINPATGVAEGLLGDSPVFDQDEVKWFVENYDVFEAQVRMWQRGADKSTEGDSARATTPRAITSFFVVMMQPLSRELPCQIVRVIPYYQGKATAEIIEQMMATALLLEQDGFSVRALSWDGDSTFHATKAFVEGTRMDSRGHFTFPDTRSVCVDPLHILKRCRYRYLGSCVYNTLVRAGAETGFDDDQGRGPLNPSACSSTTSARRSSRGAPTSCGGTIGGRI